MPESSMAMTTASCVGGAPDAHPALVRVLECVADQVLQQLVEEGSSVDSDERGSSIRRSIPRARANERELRTQLREDLGHGHVDADGLDRAGLQPADVEQRVEQARHALDRLALLLQQLADLRFRDDLQHRRIEQRIVCIGWRRS